MTWALLRTSLVGRRVFTVLTWTLLLLPTFLAASGLEVVAEQNGPLSWLVGHDPSALRRIVMGPVGVVWVLACRGVPFAYLALAGSIRSLGGEYEEAALCPRGVSVGGCPGPFLAAGTGDSRRGRPSCSPSRSATSAWHRHWRRTRRIPPGHVHGVLLSLDAARRLRHRVSGELALTGHGGLGRPGTTAGIEGAYVRERHRTNQIQARRALRPATQIVGALAVGVFFVVSVGVPVLGIVATSMTPPPGTEEVLTFAELCE